MHRQRIQSKNPAPEAMLEGLRSIGYDFSTAVADIIDNCVPAKASRVDVFFDGDNHDPYFEICDNGEGMSLEQLDAAMDFGTDRFRDFSDKNDLGRFGLGLKTASLSQCRRFTVVSKQNGMVYASCWDIDLVIKNKSWDVLNLDDEEISALPNIDYLDGKESGTIVLWQKFDRISQSTGDFSRVFSDRCSDARSYCALVFHRFYSKMVIAFNNRRVEKMDPFLESFDNKAALQPVTFPYNGSVVRVQAYRMPTAEDMTTEEKDLIGGLDSLRRDQGFYIYRNDRLILWGKWLRVEHRNLYSRLARIKVDIPATLDKEWSLDVKKSTAVIPDDIRKKLWASINDGLGQSAKRIRYEGEREVSKEYERIWIRRLLPDNKVTYELNENYPVYERLVDSFTDEQKQLFYAYMKDVEGFVPTSKMRDDVADDLKVINKTNEPDQKEDLKAQLYAYFERFPDGENTIEDIGRVFDELVAFEKYSVLKDEKNTILKEYFDGRTK